MKLKRICLTGLALLGCLLVEAQEMQEARVEKSVWGVQAGLLSSWGYNELRLSDAVVLRSEIGLVGGFALIYTNIFGEYSRYIIMPEVAVEPRWYYDLARRQARDRRTIRNSGNYFSLRTSFNPKCPVISDSYTTPTNLMTMVPMWGIRRHFGRHFSLEAGIGAGYWHRFDDTGSTRNRDGIAIEWRFCVGYTF
ncbi:MAG: hypothetical protein LBP50_11185 [Tannerella sp.]|jgi:hypothetical protein|nr:hypothetical protein [Tannerella sp.]